MPSSSLGTITRSVALWYLTQDYSPRTVALSADQFDLALQNFLSAKAACFQTLTLENRWLFEKQLDE